MSGFDEKSLIAARSAFVEHGESVAEWSRARGFDPNLVYHVLNGRCQGRRGVSHRIALALGLKPLPTSDRREAPSTTTEAPM
jgi:gp16 family phage-associated protein